MVAKAAAEGFDHVQVFDSGHISCGEGLIVLYAASLAEEGYKAQEIVEMLKVMKQRVVSKYMMPSADVFAMRGRTTQLMAAVCRFLILRPVLAPVKSRVRIVGFGIGAMDTAWRGFLRVQLRKKKISTDAILITHSGLSVREQEYIRSEVMRMVPFKRIIMNRASFTNACSVGPKTIGISYYVNNYSEPRQFS